MVTSRQRLFRYLQEHTLVTVAEVSRALQMTPANARHHLSILVEEGVVKTVGERPARGQGRPAQLYRITRQAEQNNIDRLAGACLDLLWEGKGAGEREVLLSRLVRGLSGDRPVLSAGDSLTRRLVDACQELTRWNYQARWEAHAQGPRVIYGHCPFASILAEHPEMCRVDAALLEDLLGEGVEQTARLAQDTRGARYCMFVVRGKKEKPAAG